MKARLYDRLAAFASTVFLLGLAAGTYYLAVWVNNEPEPAVETTSNEPDVFIEGVALTRVNADGRPVFRMSAEDMVHYPIDGSSAFTQPRLISLDENRPRMSVRADRAMASREGETTVLEGNVVLTREADPDNPALIVRTERLTLTPDDETARTDMPVEIENGQYHLQGTGMAFDNLNRELRLFAQVRADWTGRQPEPQP